MRVRSLLSVFVYTLPVLIIGCEEETPRPRERPSTCDIDPASFEPRLGPQAEVTRDEDTGELVERTELDDGTVLTLSHHASGCWRTLAYEWQVPGRDHEVLPLLQRWTRTLGPGAREIAPWLARADALEGRSFACGEKARCSHAVRDRAMRLDGPGTTVTVTLRWDDRDGPPPPPS
jgi:hypothetical protein